MFDSPVFHKKWTHSFFALQIPKTASSSITKACGTRNLIEKHKQLLTDKLGRHPLYRGVFDVRHAIPEHLYSVFGDKILGFFCFAVVRNPGERLVSSFSFGREKKLWNVYGLTEDCSFEQYVDWLWKNRKRDDVLILRPQATWTHGNILRPKILRMENLASEWPQMLKEQGIEGISEVLPHENKSTHKPWQEYYSSESFEKMLDIYSEDAILRYQNKL